MSEEEESSGAFVVRHQHLSRICFSSIRFFFAIISEKFDADFCRFFDQLKRQNCFDRRLFCAHTHMVIDDVIEEA